MTALSGIRVLDLAGPLGWYAGKLLGDLGADVLRIEPPGGDPARRRGPFWHHDSRHSLPFWYFNTSKRSETIDLDGDAGRARFLALLANADVVIETARPGALDAQGIGYAAAHPGLVWTAITPFGQTGPYAHWKANDLVLQAMGGLAYLAGMPGRPPSQLGGNQAEYQAGVIGAVATQLALRERDRSGLGQFVDVSAQAAVAIDGENALPYWDVERWVRPRLGIRNYAGIRQVFQSKDGWVVMAFGSRWKTFLDWVKQAGLMTDDWADPRWESGSYRVAHNDAIEQLCVDLCASGTRAEIYRAGQEKRVAIGPVVGIDDLFLDPQLAARGFWQRVTHPEIEQDVTYPGPPYRLSATPWTVTRPPLAGEHTGEGWRLRSDAALMPAAAGGPLAGIRVIDMSWVAAAPLATRVLALFGAEVIRIETGTHPDGSRVLPTARPKGNSSVNVSGMWNNLNPGKASVAIDLRNPGAVKLLEQLIKTADVLVDNYGVDPFPKWGLTLDRLRELQPDLIIARSSVMGRSGPRAHYVGLGYTISATAGHNAITGFPGDPPVGSCIAHPDYSCNPYHFAVAILAALRHRDRTGQGQSIDLSQHESTVTWIGPEVMAYAANGAVAGPPANRHPEAAPHGIYPAQGDDAWIAIACETDAEFAALCRTIGQPDLAARFATLANRKANEDALDAILSAWTSTRTPDAAMTALQQAGVPAGDVRTYQTLVDTDPALRTRAHYITFEHAEAGTRLADGPPAILSRTPGAIRRPAPLLGEDNDVLLTELLGLDEEEMAMGYVEGWFQ